MGLNLFNQPKLFPPEGGPISGVDFFFFSTVSFQGIWNWWLTYVSTSSRIKNYGVGLILFAVSYQMTQDR